MSASGQDFRDFVESRYSSLLRTAYLLTGRPADAEDLLQTALLRVMRAWSRVEGQPEAYVRRVMVNHLISRWRRQQKIREYATAEPPEVAVGTGVDIELRDELWRALGQLPRRMRAVLVLRYWEDLPEAEVAAVLGCAPGTVKSQASRGLARLRELVGSGTPALPGSPLAPGEVAMGGAD